MFPFGDTKAVLFQLPGRTLTRCGRAGSRRGKAPEAGSSTVPVSQAAEALEPGAVPETGKPRGPTSGCGRRGQGEPFEPFEGSPAVTLGTNRKRVTNAHGGGEGGQGVERRSRRALLSGGFVCREVRPLPACVWALPGALPLCRQFDAWPS